MTYAYDQWRPKAPPAMVKKNPGFFFKKAQPSGFFGILLGLGVLLGFLDQQEKIGKIIKKLSNLKP